MKRVVIISDEHCGARTGLTPPGWQYQDSSSDPEYKKFAKIQSEMWTWYAGKIAELQPIDLLIVNGDNIDGKGEKSGGTELLEADRNKQCQIAIECISEAQAKRVGMTYGTPYHSGVNEDWENVIAKAVNAKIGGQEWYNVGGKDPDDPEDPTGLIFDCKHFISSSIIPHGRHTSVNRDALWNLLYSEINVQPKSDVIIRSHVHYFAYSGNDRYLCIITPALQAFKTKFGVRKPSGIVNIGLISFDVESKTEYTWKVHLLNPVYQRTKALKI